MLSTGTDQDHGDAMGTDPPAPCDTRRHAADGRTPVDVRKPDSATSAVTVRHVLTRALNPRVRGSSPWRRTRTDLRVSFSKGARIVASDDQT
jgi:hypothetical protein